MGFSLLKHKRNRSDIQFFLMVAFCLVDWHCSEKFRGFIYYAVCAYVTVVFLLGPKLFYGVIKMVTNS